MIMKKNGSYLVNSNDPNALTMFHHYFEQCFFSTLPKNIKNVLLLCIGTDRSTGDSLGPLVGHQIAGNRYHRIHILGTLENPVHAKNLEETIKGIRLKYPSPFVIALDACLGRHESIGNINISPGPLKPGAGVHKSLPWVGDMHINGVVNTEGFMEYIILQNTRLHVVMKMAEIIAKGLHKHFVRIDGKYALNYISSRVGN